ncbi:MAG: hypothetical protein HUU55_13035 [Myxococcales bacterium]|nr:hypothetical protein [Myxococcales bacterium]
MRVRRIIQQLAAMAVLALVALWVVPVSAAPQTLLYYGDLRADNGLPYNGDVDVEVTIYDAATGGNDLWDESIGAVTVNNGEFRVILGNGGSGSIGDALATAPSLWLEFSIDGQLLEPRQKLDFAPYALQAGNAGALGGEPASSYVTKDYLDTYNIPPSSLPDDGLDEISNDTISNEYIGVLASASGMPKNIPDNTPGGVNSTITTTESTGARMTKALISFELQVTFVSKIKATLIPTGNSGVGPIVLLDQTLAPQSPTIYQYTTEITPALAVLIDTDPSGTWTLNVADLDLTGGVSNAKVTKFEILYDVIRANGLQINAKLDQTGDLGVDGNLSITGTADIGGTFAPNIVDASDYLLNGNPLWTSHWTKSGNNLHYTAGKVGLGNNAPSVLLDVNGNVRATGQIFRKLQIRYTDSDMDCDNCTGGQWQWTFNKKRADTGIHVIFHGATRAINSSGHWRVRINDGTCSNPRDMQFSDHQNSSVDEHATTTSHMYCVAVGGNPIPAGNNSVKLQVEAGGDVHEGWNSPSFMVIEEVYIDWK